MLVYAALYAAAGVTVLILIFLIGSIFWKGLRNLSWQLLTTQPSYLADTIGILPNILNTLYVILTAMAIALPLGV